LNVWHTLRRECSGAWRSVRYDLATHRAARLSGALTEEFAPSSPPVPTPSRLVPLTGVTLLLAGGAAGAFLAISGGLAALDTGPPPAEQAVAAVPARESTGAVGPTTPASPVGPHRAATRRTPSPGTPPTSVSSPPITESSELPTSPSADESSAPASASASPSPSETSAGRRRWHREGPRSREPGTGR
jgi:hypothetical protein